jgi:hypothetical protein
MARQRTHFDQQRLEVPLIENGDCRHHLPAQPSRLTGIIQIFGHAQQIVGCAMQRLGDLHQCLQVGITKPGGVVAVPAFAYAGTSSGFGIADAQLLCPRPQVFRQYVHGNKMFRAAPRVYVPRYVVLGPRGGVF